MSLACLFLGTWDAGTTRPGQPYIAKWPDQFGNIKTREVLRPDIISKYFGSSNVIDVGNQLRQNELGLERAWLTKDPWFRIDTTVIGMCVTDAFNAASQSAPSGAKIDKMTLGDFAMHTAVDCWTRKVSNEARVDIPSSSNTLNHDSASTDEGEEVTLESHLVTSQCLTFGDAVLAHKPKRTKQRGTNNDLARRVCQMKADDGCDGTVTTECKHPACMQKTVRAKNRFGDKTGVFLCDNDACRRKHAMQVIEQSRAVN